MKSIKSVAVGAALLTMAGMVGAVEAQQSGTPQNQRGAWGSGYMMGPGMMGPNGMMGWTGPRAAMCGMMTSHIEGRLAFLKTELNITDAQASLWNAYAGAARDNAQAMATHCTATMSPAGSSALSLPDRLDQHERFMAAQLDALRATNKTLKPLYAALSDSQKQTADQFLGGPMGMM
ncbi:MAG TPA: Spy/CpxP family protein refolding chaperone [Stellaceae bacterium]|nr:Spy/CpxP family protein refolding chaperone [Stellaceae bacterium]